MIDGTVNTIPSKSYPGRLNEMTANSVDMNMGMYLRTYVDRYDNLAKIGCNPRNDL